MKKSMNPKLEKREERLQKDLDDDGERGESKVHQKKVLGTCCPSCKKMGKTSCRHGK